MKKRIAPTLFIIFILIIAPFAIASPKDIDNNKVSTAKIAAILNLTGPAARFDAVKQQALQIALTRVRELHPKISFDLLILDAGGGPDTTSVAVRRARDWGAQYFLSGTSPTALAIAAQVRNIKPPVVQIANAANPYFGPPKKNQYRFWPDWRQESEIVAQIMMNQRLNRVLLIHSADPYSEALTKELQNRIQQQPNIIIRDYQFDPASTPDFRPSLIRAKQENLQAIVVFGLPPGINALINQLADVGWNGALIGGINLNLAVEAYDKANLKGPLFLVQTEAMLQHKPLSQTEVEDYRIAYKSAYNQDPPFHALYLADALYFIGAIHDFALTNGVTLDRAREETTIWDSASGLLRMLEDGTLKYIMNTSRAR